MMGIIDCHSHILPGIDDGSQSVAESIAMLKMQAEQGIGHVIATPHFYPQYDTPEHFIRKRYEAWQRLMEETVKYRGLPEVSLGAEVYFYRGISESSTIDELTIDGNRCILIEMISAPWQEFAFRELETLYTRRGLLPIVAHVDRYIRPLHTYGIPKRLEQMPVMVQANADFFLDRGTRNMALRMLKAGRIHLLGSDCHSTRTRKPNLLQAVELIEKKLGAGALERIAECQQDIWM